MIRSLALAWLVAICSLAGCAQKPTVAVVTGTVTYRGNPVSGGIVMFVPPSGPTATGTIDSQGNYRISTFGLGDGALPGTYPVSIRPVPPGGEMKQKRSPGTVTSDELPSKYTDHRSSNLTAEVKEGNNVVNFDLE